jgi:hypothetical protein
MAPLSYALYFLNSKIGLNPSSMQFLPLIACVQYVPDFMQVLEMAYHFPGIPLHTLLPQGLSSQAAAYSSMIRFSVGMPFSLELGVVYELPIEGWPPTGIGLHLPQAPQESRKVNGPLMTSLVLPRVVLVLPSLVLISRINSWES